MTVSHIGRYEVERELGRGAMAIVYKAVDPVIGRIVAIKTIRIEHDLMGMKYEELRQRLYREAKSAGSLNHPNIVTIYDIGEEGDVTYITMEYVEGESLDHWMSRYPIAPLDQTLSIVEQVASGLDYAAVRGIIHRDVKPGNILLTTDGRPKIADFGIAKLSMSDITQTGVIMGTPSYMSPEQAMGKTLDGRSDMWSLGVIFYQMLTGEKPFAGSNPTTIIYKIVHEDPVPPRKINTTLHPGFDHLVQKMLAKDPEGRYQTCSQLIQDLRNYTRLSSPTPEALPTVAMPSSVTPPVPAPSPTPTTGSMPEFKPQRNYFLPVATFALIAAIVMLGIFMYQQTFRDRQTPVAQQPAPGVTQPVGPQKGPETPTKGVAGPDKETEPEKKAEEPKKEEAPKKEPPVVKVAPARVEARFSGPSYGAVLYDGSRRLSSFSSTSEIQVPAGEHRFRVVSEDVHLDLQVGSVSLEPNQVYPLSLPGLSSAYIELVPNDAYEGCEILLNGQKLPTPYPAAIPRLAATRHRLAFRWNSGRYLDKEFNVDLEARQNHHVLILGDPRSGQAQITQQPRR